MALGPVLPWFVPVISLFQSLTYFTVAFLSFQRHRVMRDPASFWIGMGGIGIGLALVFYSLTWPGLGPHGGSIVPAQAGTPAWFVQFGLSALSSFLLWAALARRPCEDQLRGRRLTWVSAAWVFAIILVFAAILKFERQLPVLVGPDGVFAFPLHVWNASCAVLFALGAVLSKITHRKKGDALFGYIFIAQIGFTFGAVMAVIGTRRYDPWWYMVRAVVTGSSLMVLFGLLSEYVHLFRREREKTLQARESEERYKLLSRTAERLLEGDDATRSVQEIATDVMTHMDCHVFFNYLADRRSGRLVLNACAGVPDAEREKVRTIEYGAAVCGCVARDRTAQTAGDIDQSTDVHTALVRSMGIKAYCCHPLISGGNLIGTLSFGTRTRTRFGPDEIDLMRGVADQVAISLQRFQAREALRESELRQSRQRQFLETLLETAQACIAVMQGRDLRYTLVNASYQSLRPDVSMIGRTYRDVFPEAAKAGAEDLLRSVLDTGEPHMARGYPAPIPGKPDAAWDHQIVRLASQNSHEPAVLVITWDATEHKRAQHELKRLNETLEQRVSERTRLAESRAKQLRTLAVEVIEAEERERRRLADLLHEDLQQVLAAANMQLETSPHTEERTTTMRLLRDAIQKSRRLSHELSPSVLHYSGLGASLTWLARQVREQFGLDVRITLPEEEIGESTTAKTFLFRAAQELLFNIKKHAGVHHAEMELSYTNDCITLAVSDTGTGFMPDDLNAGKAGLGLLKIRERAAYFGGRFDVVSAPGEGARLTVSVPASLDTDGRVDAAATDSDESIHRPQTSSLRVLFVDDHKVMRQGLVKLLSGQPQIRIVGEAANGAEAIEMVRRYRPDVVVMDVSMPVMDGIEATRRIKSEYPEVRVIGLSMYEDDHLARKLRSSGAEALLSKASSSSALLKAIYTSQPTGAASE